MQKSNESVSNYSKAGERNMIKKSLIAFGIIILLIGITGGSVYMADRVFTPSTNEDKTIENTESSRKQEQTEIQNSTSPTITTKEQQTKNEKNKETEDTMKSSKTIALTFDDGPNPSTTPKLLEVLTKRYTCHFFCSRRKCFPERTTFEKRGTRWSSNRQPYIFT